MYLFICFITAEFVYIFEILLKFHDWIICNKFSENSVTDTDTILVVVQMMP